MHTMNAPATAWTEIRNGAVEAAGRGWPVVPGTFQIRNHWHGRPGATELCPVDDGWPTQGITDPEQALEVWTHLPYGVLLVCGHGVDALELPAELVELFPALAGRGLAAPLATVGRPPRWLLFVATGDHPALLPALNMADAKLRSRGDWVPLPPTLLTSGVRAALPDGAEVQQLLAAALASESSDDGDR